MPIFIICINTFVRVRLEKQASLASQKRANKACAGCWGFCAIYKHFSDLEFFLLPNRVHARPSASNANCWAVALQTKLKLNIEESQRDFGQEIIFAFPR
jgi:hypothetical protein